MGGPRVGLVCGHFDPARDGVADYTRQLARHLRPTGVQPLICTAHRYADDDAVVGVTDRWTVTGVRRAAQAIADLRLDVLHVQFAPSAFGFSRAVGLLPRFVPAGTPMVVTLHEYGVWAGGRLRSMAWSGVERRARADRETLLLAPRAERVLVAAPEHATVLRARFPNRCPLAVSVPIGANIAVAPLDRGQARASVRRALRLAPGATLAVSFGFLHPEKGLERLIDAVARLRRAGRDVALVLAGGTQSHSVSSAAAAALRARLEAVARHHGVAQHVRFTGYLPAEEVSRVLLAADVAVFALNIGVAAKSGSLLTALYHGVPTIATAPPGTLARPTELDGVFRVPPRDTTALADALHRVLTDPALADRLTTAGRARAARHAWPAIAEAHAEIYAEVLGREERACQYWTA